MHAQLDLTGPIPTCIHITGAGKADAHWLDELFSEGGTFYVMDRASSPAECTELELAQPLLRI